MILSTLRKPGQMKGPHIHVNGVEVRENSSGITSDTDVRGMNRRIGPLSNCTCNGVLDPFDLGAAKKGPAEMKYNKGLLADNYARLTDIFYVQIYLILTGMVLCMRDACERFQSSTTYIANLHRP